ncbi:MAG TPA: adenylate/guanylate cyclase domain-containing protein [Mycobacteriales bacterium]|nr:adenylate/guanylate cyclase domain-containing protein [Mycobacteriales bacterium]
MDDLDRVLLGAPMTLTRGDVLARVDLPEGLVLDVWAALGFPEVPDGVVAFTELDVQALEDSAALLATGVVDAATWLVMARTMGQSLARLAEAQLDVFRKVAADLDVTDATGAALGAAGLAVPRIEALLMFVWRRQFAAAVQRALAFERSPDELASLTVGFVDLVDYTKSSRAWDPVRLEQTLEVFERGVSLRVTAVGGRVVKTLGDGVLFTTPSPRGAVEVALETVEAHAADEEMPTVRAGLATGAVLERLGDVYGEAVNLASRLCDEARPSSVLVDRVAAGALGDDEDLSVRQLERRPVRGFRSLSPFLVRRAG